MKYRAVIFDLFGTLVDSFSVREHERILSEMAAVLSAPHDDFVNSWLRLYVERATGVFATFEACIEHICQALELQPERHQIEQAARLRIDLTRRNLKPRRDALQTLSQLRALGHKTALISDCSPEVPILWEDTPFAPLMDASIFSSSVGLKKPDPRIYQIACERLAVEPHECLYVGDGGSRELTGASRVGMHPVLIRVPHLDEGDAHRVDAEEWQGPVISALKDVLALV